MKRRLIPASARCRRVAFSLIEMIGVMAVIAILVAILLPHWIKRIDLRVRTAEVATLVTVSNALSQQVLRGVALPSDATWTQAVAGFSLLPASKVHANDRRYQRVYYYERDAFPGPGYVQTISGLASPPKNLRAMVVSILGGDALDTSNWHFPSGGELITNYFNALWTLEDNQKPQTGTWAKWNGQPEDLLIQRIDYAPLFHHLILLNREGNETPSFTIGTDGPQYIAKMQNNMGWGAYYLHGTVVGLGDPDGLTMTRHVLREDISFVWEKGQWRAEILGPPESDSVADDFAQKAREFLAATRYQRKGGGAQPASQEGVVTCMYNFMLSYIFWANECPLFDTHGVSREQVAEYRVLDEIGKNDNSGLLWKFSKNLVDR